MSGPFDPDWDEAARANRGRRPSDIDGAVIGSGSGTGGGGTPEDYEDDPVSGGGGDLEPRDPDRPEGGPENSN